MLVMTSNMVDLKDEILTEIDVKFNNFKIVIMVELRNQIKQEVLQALEKEIKNWKNWNPLFVCFRNM